MLGNARKQIDYCLTIGCSCPQNPKLAVFCLNIGTCKISGGGGGGTTPLPCLVCVWVSAEVLFWNEVNLVLFLKMRLDRSETCRKTSGMFAMNSTFKFHKFFDCGWSCSHVGMVVTIDSILITDGKLYAMVQWYFCIITFCNKCKWAFMLYFAVDFINSMVTVHC